MMEQWNTRCGLEQIKLRQHIETAANGIDNPDQRRSHKLEIQ